MKKTNFTKLTQRKGISLIVLIVTIIVIIILAAAVILTLSKNNPIESAREAKFKEDITTMQDELSMYLSSRYTKELGTFDSSTVDLEGEAMVDELPSTDGYQRRVKVSKGKLVYIGENEKEKEWAENLGTLIQSKNDEIEEVITNYTAEEIDNNELLYRFGRDDFNEETGYDASVFVVGVFNEDYTELTITKNGKDSDGIMGYSVVPSFAKATLNSVIIKNGVVSIGSLYACKELSEITIPNSVTEIQSGAFSQCENLKTVYIPDSVTYIGAMVFGNDYSTAIAEGSTIYCETETVKELLNNNSGDPRLAKYVPSYTTVVVDPSKFE